CSGSADTALRRGEARRFVSVVSWGRNMGERGGEQRAADAIAERVELTDAGLPVHGIDRREDAFAHIVLEGLLREAGIGVHPGNQKHSETLTDRPFDERLLGHEIE